jgi:hypothetical protein
MAMSHWHRRGSATSRRTRTRTRTRRVSTPKVKAFRERKKHGLIHLHVYANADKVADLLIEHGYLGEWDAEDHAKIQNAWQEYIAALLAYDT